jgi:hypothetical protein
MTSLDASFCEKRLQVENASDPSQISKDRHHLAQQCIESTIKVRIYPPRLCVNMKGQKKKNGVEKVELTYRVPQGA